MILSFDRSVRIELTSGGILHSCMVTLRLGEYRDVVLGLNDDKNYGRRGSEFYDDLSCVPEYTAAEEKLAVVYKKGTIISNNIFFNLKGCGVGNIEDHNLTIYSGRFCDDGSLVDVTDTPLDFRIQTPIAERIRVGYEPLVRKQGYDHVYEIDGAADIVPATADEVIFKDEDGNTSILTDRLNLAAILLDRARTLEMYVYTNMNYIHLYTANRMSGRDIGKGGCIYPNRGGVALMPCTFSDEPLTYDGICVYGFTPKETL